MIALRRGLVPGLVLALAMLVSGVACDKGGATTAAPGAKKDSSSAAGVSLRYAPKARSLKQNTKFEFTLSGGGQYGEMKMTLAGTLAFEPAGDGHIKVAWKIDDVESMELKGMMKPKAKEGEDAPPDPKATLVDKGKGAWVMDLRGEADKDATKALPENAEKVRKAEERKKKADDAKKSGDKDNKDKKDDAEARADKDAAFGEQLLAYMDGVFQLPTLPEGALELGNPLKIEEEEEAPLGGEGGGGPVLPVESQTTYTLIKIDESSGQRIAEFEVAVEASGATEYQGGMLVVDQATEGTLLFNIDEGVPVQVNLESSQSFSFGDQGSELTTILQSSFEPG